MNRCSSTNKDDSDQDECGEIVASDLKIFTYGELELATENFGNHRCLGGGSSGKVYKGWVDETTYSPSEFSTGLPIAIKRHPCQISEETKEDLKWLREMNHPNLVKLIGYCVEVEEELLLVNLFMQNGSLEANLINGALARLTLVTKVKIVLGIARGIVFLHERLYGVGPPLSQEDDDDGKFRLDKHHIFLDEDFTAKISDFDVTMSKADHYIGFKEDGYYYPGFAPFRLRSNLFGFTVLFTEVLTGKQISNNNEWTKMKDLLVKRGIIKSLKSLNSMARQCLQICNKVKSESKMLGILNNFHEIYLE